MIRITPYYERSYFEKMASQQKYLRMIAAVTPFLAEDILFDDPEGQNTCNKIPKKRIRIKNGQQEETKLAKLLNHYRISDGHDPTAQLQAEAKLAERIILNYSDKLHKFLYNTDFDSNGRVNQKNLRELLLLKLPHGTIPPKYRFDLNRSGTIKQQKKHAKDLYEYVFRYDDFSELVPTKGHCGIHEFVEMLGVKVCPYCNRMFTTTVNTKKRRIRPQLDHFRNKSKYPFLALSINNLVPTCGVCNLLKLNQDKDLVYPYEEDFKDEDRVFKSNIPMDHTVPALEGIRIAEQDFEIMIERQDPNKMIKDTERNDRIEHSIQELALTELYQCHRDYVAFLYRQRYILTKQLAQDIYNQFKVTLFESVEEVEHVFTLMYTDYKHWGDRPLAKLTHDIIAEIDALYSQYF